MPSLRLLSLTILLVVLLLGEADSKPSQKTRVKRQTPSRFQNLYFFGDSLCDVGNLYEATDGLAPTPPEIYYEGTITNGPVWTQYLATNLGLPSQDENNFCWASATSDDEIKVGTYNGYPVDSIRTQVEDYLSSQNGQADPQALYLFMFNGNDYSNNPAPNPDLSISNWFESIEMVYQAGAKHFVIFTLPSVPPRFMGDEAAIQLIGYHSFLVRQFYESFAADHPDATTWLYDLEMRVIEVSESPESYGFTNVVDQCVTFSPTEYCQNPDEYLWYDSLHMTTSFQRIMGEDLSQMLTEEEPQPSPSPQDEATLEVHYYFEGIIPPQATCSCNK